ncbi:hypothetical protein BC351_32595 [Paenibacillus ferrarius]|uniref:Uncharacterized protein n=1 Tax=Paenibacillus ferrarius TaxID=1469647 RepID=A0A1V4HED0_9BACL|nr:hypothetical protein [Paenibacillus ferrarius]OPH52998.1 hypothetical protein BC351_32595 [Paenibacillus ferrarius]
MSSTNNDNTNALNAKILQNAIEISVNIGLMMGTKQLISTDSDVINSDSIQENVVLWATQFANKYGHIIDPEEFAKVPELNKHNESFGYLAAIDTYTRIKCEEVGWAGKPYDAEDYEAAKKIGLDLDNWNDYSKYYQLGTVEEKEE